MDVGHEMPEDWDDHAGWEAYYAEAPEAASRAGHALPFGYSEAVRFAPWLRQRGYRKLWFAGCGVDGAPRVYASFGSEVWASDVSPSAITYQRLLADRPYNSLPSSILESVRRNAPDMKEWQPGALHAVVHDFREPFPEDAFDCILNIRAFQALPADSPERAAQTFFVALRPGGHAFFDTQNVQGERRDQLEDALLSVGFVLPGNGSERWFRRALADAEIPHDFVLGRPCISFGDVRYKGGAGKAQRKADQKLVNKLAQEFDRRIRADADEEQRIWSDPTVRTATVVYNTG